MKIVLSRIAGALSDLRDFASREPALVRYLLGLVVTVAARYGLALDAEVVWSYLVVGGGVTAATRGKVTPVDSYQRGPDA